MAVVSLTLSPSAWPWRRAVEGAGACMDGRELARWDVANARTAGLPIHAASPCRDCTAAFAAEMLSEGRCHGRPGSGVMPRELEALRRRHVERWEPRPQGTCAQY